MNPEETMPGAPTRMPTAAYGLNECAKEAGPRDTSYIDRDPAKQVVLSPRLEQLVRRVGGCQTEEVMALVRGIMYEVISQRKY